MVRDKKIKIRDNKMNYEEFSQWFEERFNKLNSKNPEKSWETLIKQIYFLKIHNERVYEDWDCNDTYFPIFPSIFNLKFRRHKIWGIVLSTDFRGFYSPSGHWQILRFRNLPHLFKIYRRELKTYYFYKLFKILGKK